MLSREGSNGEIQYFMCSGAGEISYHFDSHPSDFVAPRNASHDLQSINCPSLVVDDLIGVTACISSLFDGLVCCELSGNNQMLEARSILLPHKGCRRNTVPDMGGEVGISLFIFSLYHLSIIWINLHEIQFSIMKTYIHTHIYNAFKYDFHELIM